MTTNEFTRAAEARLVASAKVVKLPREACFDVPLHHEQLWEEHVEASTTAAAVEREGDKRAHGFGSYMSELHHRLFAETPRPIDKPGRAAAVRSKLHSLASELPEFATLRKQTVRSPLWAGMATSALAQSVKDALPETETAPPDAEKARRMLEGLQGLADSSPQAAEKLGEHLARAEGAFSGAEFATAEQAAGIDETAVRQALRAAIERTQKEIDDAGQALAMLGYGEGAGLGAGNIDPGVAIELAKRVRSSETLKRIIELAGRLTLTARAKRASRSEYARSEVVGVEQVGSFSNLLPTELSGLATPIGTAALYRKVLERSALGYKMEGKERESKGPIIVLIDQSGSMTGDRDVWAKAVALALLDAARHENRAFGIVLYSDGIKNSALFPVASEASHIEILDLLSTAPSGGTNFAQPMLMAMQWISQPGTFKKADVVHITDGQAPTEGADNAMNVAKMLGAHIYGVAITAFSAGLITEALRAWSHEVVSINDVSADAPALDLIFDHV